MADPIAIERAHLLKMLGIPDDPSVPTSDLRYRTAYGADAHRTAFPPQNELYDQIIRGSSIAPENNRRAVGQDEIIINAAYNGIRGDGLVDNSEALHNLLSDLTKAATVGAKVILPPTEDFYRFDGPTVRVPREIELEIPRGTICRRPSTSSITDPIFRLGANGAKLVGHGIVETETPSPWGAILIGPRDLSVHTNVLGGVVSVLTVKGVQANGNIGIRLSSSFVATGGATYQNNIKDVVLDFFGTGVYVADVANANEFHGVQLLHMNEVGYDFNANTANRGADECAVLGGFIHSSPGATGIRMRNAIYNQILGLRMEMGTGSKGYDLDADTENNHLVIINNNPVGSVDDGFENVILSNGRLSGLNRRVVKAADQAVTNSTTYTPDTHLTQRVRRNCTYEIDAYLIYDGPTAGDGKILITAPTGSSANWNLEALNPAAANDIAARSFLNKTLGQGQTFGCAGVGTKTVARLRGEVTIGGATGDFGLSWAQVVADASPLTMYAGSSLKLKRL